MTARAAAAVLLAAACAAPSSAPPARLHYLATARQLGPVGYRDPLGAVSPDGEWLAYSVQQHLYVQRVSGGPVRELPERPRLILQLVWLPDSRGIAVEHARSAPRWWLYDREGERPLPLWPAGHALTAAGNSGGAPVVTDSLRQLAWTRDGAHVAGVRVTPGGAELWVFNAGGDSARVRRSAERLSFPAFAPDGHLACLSGNDTRQVVSDPCGERAREDVVAYGPIAFSPRGDSLYYATPDSGGILNVWSRAVAGGAGVRVSGFSRDSYAPVVTRHGALMVAAQTYRTVVGVVDAAGGAVRQIAGFQSETPSWDPTGKWIGLTFGSWRRVIDDVRYPDIAQDVGIVSADPDSLPSRPVRVVDASPSEDQSLAWSPNGRWIVYHSHQDQGDDLYLVPADGSAPARRITSFGRGFETGWPRWSPDGHRIAFDADSRGPSRASVIYVIGVDQATGTVTAPEREIALAGFEGEAVHAEWLPDGRLAVLGEMAGGEDAILVVPAAGGPVRRVYAWRSEHRFGGLGISPDGRFAAFIAPAADGRFQLFRVPMGGGTPEQLTHDPTDKTQPSYSPDGKSIALTVFDYAMQFWLISPS